MVSFIGELKRRQITGSLNVADATCKLLIQVVSRVKWTQDQELIDMIRFIGKRIITAQPREFAAGNIIRRTLAIIREEDKETNNDTSVSASMFQLLTIKDKKRDSASVTISKKKFSDMRATVIQGIRELQDEINSAHENIELMTGDLIHDNEILLTPTPGSETVLNFLLNAGLKRKFTVLVTESYPNNISECHSFAKKLAKANIECVIIPDAAVFAVMSRVGKVLIGTRSVFANGGCVTAAGVANVTECAKEHRTPVFAVAGLYKLSPAYPFDREQLIEVGNSGKVLSYGDRELIGKCEISNPLYDYVEPDNIDIYITNIGGFSPNFIYRIVLDNYNQEDVDLS